jgi:AcrR family transcriptional regulator
MRGDATRERIKVAARKLFVARGLGAVSIRDIVGAAGQKNSGSVNYYFKSKAALVKELIVDVAKLIDEDHNRRLNELEAAGGPKSIRDVVSILIQHPTLDSPGRGHDAYALRFLNMLMIDHRDLVFAALAGGADSGTRRCVAHLGRFAADMPAALLQQRLRLMVMFLFAAESSREASLKRRASASKLRGHPAARNNLIDSVEGMLLQPPSVETLDALDAPRTAATKPLVNGKRRSA